MQLLQVEGVVGRVLVDLVLIQKQLLIIILVVLVILIIFKCTVQLLEDQVERGLLAHESLRFG